MCKTKDIMGKTELEKKVKHYKNNLLKPLPELVKQAITIISLKKINTIF